MTDFVEQLGAGLTSTNVDDRVKATQLLSHTLRNLPEDFLNETQLNFIGTFYVDRLKDHHSVLPNTLTGILAVVSMAHVPEGTATRILHGMFLNVACQSQVRGDREKIFEILKTLTETKSQGELVGWLTVFGSVQRWRGASALLIRLYFLCADSFVIVIVYFVCCNFRTAGNGQ